MNSVTVLYGSRARSDHDAFSDTDILHVIEDSEIINECHIDFQADPGAANRSIYSWKELRSLQTSGSLFLLHLRNEGKIIDWVGNGLSQYLQILDGLKPYSNVNRDLIGFDTALSDCLIQVGINGTCLEYELSVVATVVRHSSILGCYLANSPEFGRYSAVAKFCSLVSHQGRISDDFASLYQFRLAQDGRHSFPKVPPVNEINDWLYEAIGYLDKVRSYAMVR